MARAYSWDDPFNEVAANAAKSSLIKNSAPAPVRLDAIRQRQQGLLPYLQDMFREAATAFARADALSRQVGQKPVALEIFYRRPDHPSLLQNFVTAQTNAVVLLPADGTPKLPPVLEALFPAVDVMDQTAPEDFISFFKLEGVRLGKTVDTVRIVRLQMLSLIKFWVKELDGPIFDVGIVQAPQPTGQPSMRVETTFQLN